MKPAITLSLLLVTLCFGCSHKPTPQQLEFQRELVKTAAFLEDWPILQHTAKPESMLERRQSLKTAFELCDLSEHKHRSIIIEDMDIVLKMMDLLYKQAKLHFSNQFESEIPKNCKTMASLLRFTAGCVCPEP